MFVSSENRNALKKTLGTIGILVLLIIVLLVKFNTIIKKLKQDLINRKAESFDNEY